MALMERILQGNWKFRRIREIRRLSHIESTIHSAPRELSSQLLTITVSSVVLPDPLLLDVSIVVFGSDCA